MTKTPTFQLEDVSFSYDSTDAREGVRGISIAGAAGKVILLMGESGSGKTTITKMLNGLIPHYDEGELSGRAIVCGLDVSTTPLYEISQKVGSVFQNPRSQFFTTDTTSELAFSCENQGIEPDEIRRRISHVADQLGINSLLGRNIFSLSGGEKQRIACASASTINPQLYVLDEPSSNLDMEGICHLKNAISLWKAEGKTVVVAEHRIFYIRDLVDHAVSMREGRIVQEISGDHLREMSNEDLRSMGLRCGTLKAKARHSRFQPKALHSDETFTVEIARRSKNDTDPRALTIENVKLPRHGITALVGRNGAGKSTFSLSLSGLSRHNRARVAIDGEIITGKGLSSLSYLVMQDVNHQLFAEDALEEVLLGMKNPEKEYAYNLLGGLGLKGFEDRHPMSLSGGQKQRIAIAAALAAKRRVLIYDEPTSGLDLRHMEEVASVMKRMQREGLAQIIVTHDLELIESCCTHVVEMDKGRLGAPYPLDDKGIKRVFDFFNSQNAIAQEQRK